MAKFLQSLLWRPINWINNFMNRFNIQEDSFKFDDNRILIIFINKFYTCMFMYIYIYINIHV